MNLTLLGILLIGLSLAFLIMELVVPAGGLIALVAAVSLVGGIVLFFEVNTMLGIVGALAAVILLPFVLMGLIQVFPNTPLVQRLKLQNPPMTPTHGPPTHGEDELEFQAMIGVRGEVLTDLRPVGTCMINGKRLDCLADSGMIRAGSAVRVVAADAFQIKVRLDDEGLGK